MTLPTTTTTGGVTMHGQATLERRREPLRCRVVACTGREWRATTMGTSSAGVAMPMSGRKSNTKMKNGFIGDTVSGSSSIRSEGNGTGHRLRLLLQGQLPWLQRPHTRALVNRAHPHVQNVAVTVRATNAAVEGL